MGFSIKYKGCLQDTTKVSKIRDEIKSLASTLKWDFKAWNDDWSQPCDARLEIVNGQKRIAGHFSLKGGTIIVDAQTESVPLLFDSKGRLNSPVNILGNKPNAQEQPVVVNLKNTIADNAIWILGLLKYIKKSYIPNLEVEDEADFWSTHDRQKLEQLLTPGNTSASQFTPEQIAFKLETMFKVMHN